MASFFRWRIANKVIPFLHRTTSNEKLQRPNVVSSFVKVSQLHADQPQLFLPWKRLTNISSQTDDDLINPVELVKLLRNQGLPTAEGFIDITLNESPLSIVFTVDRHVFSKIVLSDIYANEEIIAKSSCLFQSVSPKKVVVHCSSPTVGEHFKMSHFRSVIHSNFIANINKEAGHEVTKVTHVADWGLESAILLTGFHHFGTKGQLLENPSQHLSEVLKGSKLQYESDANYENEVKLCFEKMKDGDKGVVSEWNYLKTLCLKHYDSIYKKIGLTFDDTLFDSCYSAETEEIHKNLLERKLIVIQDDGSIKINMDVEGTKNIGIDSEIGSVIHSLCRFILCASHNKRKFNFDAMYHIAPTSEKNLFLLLIPLMKELGFEWSNRVHHIGLKSITHYERKLKSKNAEQILHQAKIRMLENLQTDLHMQMDETTEQMAEELSYAALCVHDMKHRRNVDYAFDWKHILNFSRNTGVALQFSHAGLKGIEEDAEYIFKVDIDTSPLLQSEAQDLIQHLSRFDEMVYKSYLILEPCIILQYLFTLWHLTDRATKVLSINIKEDRLIVLKARLMLFAATRKVLQRGLHLLGITPFETNYTPPDFMKD